jgi:hypothetical protein
LRLYRELRIPLTNEVNSVNTLPYRRWPTKGCTPRGTAY